MFSVSRSCQKKSWIFWLLGIAGDVGEQCPFRPRYSGCYSLRLTAYTSVKHFCTHHQRLLNNVRRIYKTVETTSYFVHEIVLYSFLLLHTRFSNQELSCQTHNKCLCTIIYCHFLNKIGNNKSPKPLTSSSKITPLAASPVITNH